MALFLLDQRERVLPDDRLLPPDEDEPDEEDPEELRDGADDGAE
jgi:hypothetical protein